MGNNFKGNVMFDLHLQVEILRKKFDSESTEWRGRQERAEALLAERQQEAARRLRQAEANAEQAQRRAQDESRFLTARLNPLQNGYPPSDAAYHASFHSFKRAAAILWSLAVHCSTNVAEDGVFQLHGGQFFGMGSYGVTYSPLHINIFLIRLMLSLGWALQKWDDIISFQSVSTHFS
eukprot:scaffold11093_cov16-Prasinocladus_malaysianus.AAC.1